MLICNVRTLLLDTFVFPKTFHLMSVPLSVSSLLWHSLIHPFIIYNTCIHYRMNQSWDYAYKLITGLLPVLVGLLCLKIYVIENLNLQINMKD